MLDNPTILAAAVCALRYLYMGLVFSVRRHVPKYLEFLRIVFAMLLISPSGIVKSINHVPRGSAMTIADDDDDGDGDGDALLCEGHTTSRSRI